MERADLPPQSPDDAQPVDTFAPATAPFSLASIEGAVSRRALRERTQLSEQPSTYSPESPATPSGRRAQPGEPDRTTDSGEPLGYITQNRRPNAEASSDELPPTEALATQDAPAYRFRDFSPEGRRPQPIFTPPAAPVGTVPAWGAHVAPGENEGQLDYQTDRRAPKPAEPQEHRTLTRRELRALEAQGAIAPAMPAPVAHEADQPVASAMPAPSVTPTAEVEALFAPVLDVPAQTEAAAPTTESQPADAQAQTPDAEGDEPETKTGRLFGLFGSPSKKADKAEAAERAEQAELEEARLRTQRAEAEQVEAARIEAEKAEAERRAAEQRVIEERAEQQRAEAERHAAEAAAMQAAGPATELFDVRADRAAAEREAEQHARAAERDAEERAARERATRAPEPLVEPEEPERRGVSSATDLFAALNADVADERTARQDSFAEFDFLTSSAGSAPKAEPVSIAGLFATPAAPKNEPVEHEPDDAAPAESAPTARIDTPAPFTPPRGHWSIQSDIDELTQPRENISRIIGQGSGITSNALVLPAIPNTDVMAPVASTGEILITGSFDLPAGLATTGSIPDRLDNEIDHIFDPGDREQPVTDAAPVRAVRAVSSNTSTRGVISAKRPKGSRLPLVLAGSAAVLATSVVGLVIAGWTTGVF